ncbi:DNA photolyase, FAD-binding/Cryptochrome [Zopfochytrium polystomum]|nr:DNA photolyase, FAD-binding/Cryptochrome [Zopfochytrium polystomum]
MPPASFTAAAAAAAAAGTAITGASTTPVTATTTALLSVSFMLFRNTDLRIHDNPALAAAISASAATASKAAGAKTTGGSASAESLVIPVFCFDPRFNDLSGLPATSPSSGAAAAAASSRPAQRFDPPTTWYYKLPRAGPQKTRFFCETVRSLQQSLRDLGSDLLVRFGEPERVLPALVQAVTDTPTLSAVVDAVFLHADPTFEEARIQERIRRALDALGVRSVLVDPASTMLDPAELPFANTSGRSSATAAKKNIAALPDVFTEFRKAVEGAGLSAPRVVDALGHPAARSLLRRRAALWDALERANDGQPAAAAGSHLYVLPKPAAWFDAMTAGLPPMDPRSAFPFGGGEAAALARVKSYFEATRAIDTYKATRNGLIGTEYSSKFSPWLAVGAISPRYLYHSLKKVEGKRGSNDGTYWMWFELLWRDYFKFLARKIGNNIFFWDGSPNSALTPVSTARKDKTTMSMWANGQTGVPWVDANMRELQRTGFMSNRGRQNVASFLAKDLRLDWRFGAEYFESQLLDHDPASNFGNWQYVAGVGVDPRENRTFNMIKQALDYDPTGAYVRRWLPALDDGDGSESELAGGRVHTPWAVDRTAIARVTARARQRWDKEEGGELGRQVRDEVWDYPPPLVVKANWSAPPKGFKGAGDGGNGKTRRL